MVGPINKIEVEIVLERRSIQYFIGSFGYFPSFLIFLRGRVVEFLKVIRYGEVPVILVGAPILKVVNAIQTKHMLPIDVAEVLQLLLFAIRTDILDVVPHLRGLAARDEPVIEGTRVSLFFISGDTES